PDFDTPKHIREAAKKALDEGWTHYGPANGQPELREAITAEMQRTRGISVSPDGVVVTPGAKPIMFFAILALVNPGDEVIYPNPGFPIYESMINFVRGKAMALPLLMEKEFSFDIEDLRRLVSDNTKLLIMNSPHNPTGGKITHEDIAEIAELAKKHNFWVLSDEVYSRMQYDTPFESIASIPGMLERTIILEGFSKTYAMTGWRAGYGVMPEDLAHHITKLQVNSNSCTSSFTQRACITALNGPQDESGKMVAEFKRRRDVIVDGLNDIPGFKCLKPGGAFYVFPNIEETGKASSDLETILLNEAGVASLSGTSFGKYGDGFLRFSYANSVENIEKALSWIKDTVSKF
ncbi:pyridoxal phosphate-dependent aminotransferase, partial [candidate division KSB1 bacterium]